MGSSIITSKLLGVAILLILTAEKAFVLCSVTGLNIEDPEAARKIIKPWDERHDMQVFCESGVDDQVCVRPIPPQPVLVSYST